MELYANLGENNRVLSVGTYANPPKGCPAVPGIPRKADDTPDDPRRYRWDADAYVLVPEWAAEVDAEQSASVVLTPTEEGRIAALESAMIELMLGGTTDV